MNCEKCKRFMKCPRWKKENEYYVYVTRHGEKCKDFERKGDEK